MSPLMKRKAAKNAGKRIFPEDLSATTTPGEGGVIRLAYKIRNGRTVATARILGITIGDIEVKKGFRRRGIGAAILQDLKKRGGIFGIAGSDAGAALMKKAGMTEISPGHYSFERLAIGTSTRDKGQNPPGKIGTRAKNSYRDLPTHIRLKR